MPADRLVTWRKVKLPTFSGRQDEFSEFRNHFRELCRGERYTPVLEMAQLRFKLPNEALAAIAGLQCPEKAWKRLEEQYGNRELSILSALKNLREFKSSKSASHEVMIELASAVQKCVTMLENVKALDDLLTDRESVACIVHALPATIKDKWYDKEVPEETHKKAEVLLKWIETQRQSAVRVRLDTMAAHLRAPQQVSHGRSSQPADSTDKGLLSSALHAQGEDRTTRPGANGGATSRSKESRGDAAGSGGEWTPRVKVKTAQDAKLQ